MRKWIYVDPETIEHRNIQVHRYKKGAKIYGWTEMSSPNSRGTRQAIRSANPAMMRRLLFELENSDAKWSHFILLTLPFHFPGAKAHFLQWLSRQPWGSSKRFCWAWFQEVQPKTRRLHWHVFIGEDCFTKGYELERHWHQSFQRNGRRKDVLRGPLDSRAVAVWADCLACASLAFLAFQAGGIIERLHSAEGATRYVATYASKLDQKTLAPEEGAAGRWYNVSQKAKAKIVSKDTLLAIDFDHPVSLVWDGNRVITRTQYESTKNQS